MHPLYILFIIGLLLFTLAAIPFLLKKRENRNIRKKIEDIILKHSQTLLTRKKQLIGTDPYGNIITKKWDDEKEYFFENVICKEIDPVKQKISRSEIYSLVDKLIEHYSESPVSPKIENQDIASFSPTLYEHFCADILRQNGWEVRTTGKSGDQGIDIIAKRDGLKVVLQCKKYSHPVGNDAVQEAISGREFEKADFACVVSTASYTTAAQQLAQATGVFLLHHIQLPELYEKISVELKNTGTNDLIQRLPAENPDSQAALIDTQANLKHPQTFREKIFLFFKNPKTIIGLSFILFVIISMIISKFFFLEHQPLLEHQSLKKSKKLHLQFPHNKLSSSLENQTQMPNTAREQRQILNVIKEYYDLLDKHRYAAAYHLRNPQEDNTYPYSAFYKIWAVSPQNIYVQLQNDQVYSYNINSSVVSVLLKSQDLVQIPFPSLQTAIYRGAVSLIKLNHQWYINTEHIHEVKVIQVKKLSSLSQPFGLSKLHKKIHVSKTTNSQLFIVQVGLFQSLIHADKFHKKLDANGYNSSISRAQINGTRVYQVWIGPFHEKKLARDISHALILLGYKNATVRISLAAQQ